MKGSRFLFSLIVLLSLVNTKQAFGQKIQYHQFTTEDGLAGNRVYDLLQDKTGYIWLATETGVSRYDGYSFKNYTTKDGLPTNDVWGLFQDSQERIWLSCFGGSLVYIKQNRVYTLPLPKPVSLSEGIAEDAQGNIWHASQEGLFCITPHDNVIWFNESNSPFTYQTFVFQKTPNEVLFYDAVNSIIYQEKEQTFTSVFKADTPIEYTRLLWHDQQLVTYHEQGVTLIDFSSAIPLKKTLDSSQIPITPLRWIIPVSGAFPFLLCNDSATFRYNLREEHGYLQSNLPRLNYLRILEDRERNLWLSTPDRGVFCIPRNAFAIQNQASVLPSQPRFKTLAGNQEGLVLIGTDNGRLYNLTDSTLTRVWPNAASFKHISQIAFGLKNKVFIGIKREQKLSGLLVTPIKNIRANQLPHIDTITVRMGSSKLTNSDSSFFFFTSAIKALKADSARVSFTCPASVYHITPDPLKIDTLHSNAYLIGQRTYALAFLGQDKLWLGHNRGIQWYDHAVGKIQSPPFIDSTFSLPIKDLQYIQDRWLWVATDGFGLWLVDYKTQQSYQIQETSNHIIHNIYINPERPFDIWIATNKGIGHLVFKSLESQEYDYYAITTEDGLRTNDILNLAIHENILYAISSQDAYTINYPLLYPDFIAPQLLIDAITVNDSILEINDFYELAYDQNQLKVSFTGLSYTSQGNITYQYKLEGLDIPWQTTTNREIQYPVLPPGSYALVIKAIDSKGNESAEQRIVFNILPPWWQTLWFTISAILGIIAIISLFVILRIRFIKKRALEQTRIQTQLAEMELKALQTQLNPHFIFNSLNAIQNFYLSHDEISANDFLTRFARLMRLFLESSKMRYITLSEEIELLTLYTDLEQLRFNQKFKCKIKVDEALNPDHVQLPSLLVQPFVENAINHGLAHKKGKGHLSIQFKKEGDSLRCMVDDTGVGRAKAREIKLKHPASHRSRAMEILEERLEVLSALEQTEVTIDVVDKTDESDKATGTLVILSLPLTYDEED